MSIADNLARVREHVEMANRQAGRPAGSVRIVGASKTMSASQVAEAFRAGLTDFGENRIQEALPKIAEATELGVRPTWHFIGHLQSNKARQAVEAFDLIHSLDSVHLAHELDRRAVRPVRVLIEVNVGGEAAKSGVVLDRGSRPLDELVAAVRACPNLILIGLMTVPPLGVSVDDARPVFRKLAALALRYDLPELSMGMTDDYPVAIEEGATMVRIGRAIFGERL